VTRYRDYPDYLQYLYCGRLTYVSLLAPSRRLHRQPDYATRVINKDGFFKHSSTHITQVQDSVPSIIHVKAFF
jgi:hypothetical protein